MAHRTALAGAFSMFLIISVTCAEPIGFNWGRQTSQKILPSMVVDMLMASNITKVKMFNAPSRVLQAFAGTNIELMVAIPNEELPFYTMQDNATYFVNNKIAPYVKDCNIRYIAIGHEAFSAFMYQANDTSLKNVLPVMQNVQKALEDANLDSIKLSTPHFTDVLKNAPGRGRPSDADFVDWIKETYIIPTARFQQQHGGFFMINMNLAYLLKKVGSPLEFALGEVQPNVLIYDDNLIYTNLFDIVYDSFVWALKKNGFPNMKVVVGQVGWPTDGYPRANEINAMRFYDAFLKKLGSNKGTPLRPGPMQVYLYNLIDENMLSLARGGPFQRHWGVYKYDGTPKFPIDLTGKGQDKWLSKAQGVVYMPRRWCVFNGDRSDPKKVELWNFIACNRSDCSSTSEGGSCNSLTDDQKISYGFNMWFQITSQFIKDRLSCDFAGMGVITTNDPSVGNCTFPIQILTSIDDRFTLSDAMRISALNLVVFQFIFLAIHWIMAMR